MPRTSGRAFRIFVFGAVVSIASALLPASPVGASDLQFCPQRISFGETVSCIKPADEVDRYIFDASAGDRVLVAVAEGEDGEPDASRFALLDPNGDFVAGGPCCARDYSSVTAALALDGTYTIEFRDKGYSGHAEYFLYLQRLSRTPERVEAVLGHGSVHEARIAHRAELDTFVFNAAPGDTASFSASRLDGGITPQVRVYDPSGQLECDGEGGATCPIDDSGYHAALVGHGSSGSFDALETGKYRLTFDCPSCPAPDDTTPPEVEAFPSPLPNSNGWNDGDVTVQWDVRDVESDIASTSGCATRTITFEGETGVTCTATNEFGLTTEETVIVRVDESDPTAVRLIRSPQANAHGWSNEDVTLTWRCLDDVSEPVEDRVSETITGEGADLSATGTCEDLAGNTGSDSWDGIAIDRTDPTVTNETESGAYIGSAPLAMQASDTLSGIGQASYGGGDVHAWFVVDGQELTASESSGDRYEATATCDRFDTGVHQVTAHVKDRAHNKGDSDPVLFFLWCG